VKKIINGFIVLILLMGFQVKTAAYDINFNSNFQNNINWETGQSQTGEENSLKLGTQIGEHLHGVASIQGVENLLKTGTGTTLEDALKMLSLNEIYFELDGEGGLGADNPRLRLGTLDIRYSPYLAYFQPWQGFSVAALPLGPLSLDGFYTWNGPGQVMGGRIGLRPFINTELSFNWIQQPDQWVTSFEGLFLPFQPLVLTWAAARNQSGYNLFKIDSSLNVSQSMTIRGGYRNFPTLNQFDPACRDRRISDLGAAINPVDLYQGQTGYTLGTTLKMLGIVIDLDYDFYNQSPSPTGAEVPIAGLNRLYKLSFTKIYSLDWGSLSTGYSREIHLNQQFTRVEEGITGGIRLNYAVLRGLEVAADFKRDSVPAPGQGVYQALGTVSYQSSRFITKFTYDFFTKKTTAWTGVQIKF
jgi:hypothetical protein